MTLGIYGSGGLGREVYELALSINDKYSKWKEIVFVDDAADTINSPRDLPVYTYSELKKHFSTENIEFCIAIGEPYFRKKIFDNLINDEMKLATLIHPDVDIPKSTSIGEGTIICKYVSITCDISIGQNVYIHPMACIGHDAIIKENSVVSSFVDIPGECNIGSCTYLAINVILKQGITVGNNSIIGMGSVVYNHIPNGVIAIGNPARPMKKNEEQRVFK